MGRPVLGEETVSDSCVSKNERTGSMQRRCVIESCHRGFVALSMRVLKMTPGFHDWSKPQDSSRASSALLGTLLEPSAVSKFATMSGAID